MSYILEALKKAESERQLGGVPNLHAQNGANPDDGTSRGELWIIALLLLLVALAGVLLWRSFSAPAVQIAPVASGVATASAVPPAIPPSAPVATPSGTAQASMPTAAPVVLITTPAPGPIPATKTDIKPDLATAGAAGASSAPATLANRAVASVSASARSVPTPTPKPASVAAEPVKSAEAVNLNSSNVNGSNDALDEQLPFMAQLPEAIVREVPQVQVKGYIYSKTPSERTLIVGNNLFHEGDEVVPGVHLEKLLPKAAVLSYRGFRYRVGY